MVALVAQWFSLLDVAKTAFLAPFSSPTSQFLDYFHSSFCIRSPLPRVTCQASVLGDSTFGWAWLPWLPWLPGGFPCWIWQKLHFLHHFHRLQVNSWTISILLFALDPPWLELHAKHQFGEIPLLDVHGCPGCLVVFLARCGINCIFGTILIAYKSILGLFSFFFMHKIPLA